MNIMRTHLTELNDIIGGITEPDLVLIAGCVANGKTSFLTSVVNHLSLSENKSCLFISQSDSIRNLINRFVSIKTGIAAHNIRLGDIDSNQIGVIEKTILEVDNSQIYFIDSDINQFNLKDIIVESYKKHKVDYVVIDDVNMIALHNKEEFFIELKKISKMLNAPIIVSHTLRRLREESSITYFSDFSPEWMFLPSICDIVILLARPEVYKYITPAEINGIEYDIENLCIIKVSKYKYGAEGAIASYFDKQTMQIKDYPQIK